MSTARAACLMPPAILPLATVIGRSVAILRPLGEDFLNAVPRAIFRPMSNWFRSGFFGGLGIALLIGLFLLWLWRPERQVRLHTENLFRSIEHRNWAKMTEFTSADYHDQWNFDRDLMLESVREAFRFLRNVKIEYSLRSVKIDNSRGTWIGKISVTAEENELAGPIKERVNSVVTPFELEWRHVSATPWDWKLVRVANERLEIPAGAF